MVFVRAKFVDEGIRESVCLVYDDIYNVTMLERVLQVFTPPPATARVSEKYIMFCDSPNVCVKFYARPFAHIRAFVFK